MSDKVRMTALIVTGIVVLACILGVVAISIAFFTNAPWY